MASRSLALSLRQATRSRAALNAVKSRNQSPLLRGFATPISHGVKTESTTLSNGFTVRLGESMECTKGTTLTFADRNRALTLGTNIYGRRLDRCWQ